MFDFDNEHVARHLVYAKENGVEVECIGDWAQVSSMNASEHIARLAPGRHKGLRDQPQRPLPAAGRHIEHAHEIHPL